MICSKDDLQNWKNMRILSNPRHQRIIVQLQPAEALQWNHLGPSGQQHHRMRQLRWSCLRTFPETNSLPLKNDGFQPTSHHSDDARKRRQVPIRPSRSHAGLLLLEV